MFFSLSQGNFLNEKFEKTIINPSQSPGLFPPLRPRALKNHSIEGKNYPVAANKNE
jgi:hypothetical protein